MKVSHFGGGGRQQGAQVQPPQRGHGGLRGQLLPAAARRRGRRAFRHPGRRQPLLLCWARPLHRPDRARHPSRIAQAGRAALQGRDGRGRALPSAAFARERRARNAWIPSRDTATAGTTGMPCRRCGRGPRPTILPSTRWSRIVSAHAARTGSGTSTISSSARATDIFYHAKGATPAFRGFAEDDSGLTLIPLNMAGTDPHHQRTQRRQRPRLRSARRRPQFQPDRLHEAHCRQDRGRDCRRADARHRCPFLLRQPRHFRAAARLQERRHGAPDRSRNTVSPRWSTRSSRSAASWRAIGSATRRGGARRRRKPRSTAGRPSTMPRTTGVKSRLRWVFCAVNA